MSSFFLSRRNSRNLQSRLMNIRIHLPAPLGHYNRFDFQPTDQPAIRLAGQYHYPAKHCYGTDSPGLLGCPSFDKRRRSPPTGGQRRRRRNSIFHSFFLSIVISSAQIPAKSITSFCAVTSQIFALLCARFCAVGFHCRLDIWV